MKTNIVSIPGQPLSFIVHPIFHKGREALQALESDLLLITELEHMKMGSGPLEFDDVLGGAITRAMKEHEGAGKLGQFALVSTTGSAKIKNVLLVGIGKTGAFGRTTLCGVFNLFLEQAVACGAERASIPIFPGRLTQFSIAGLMAVLRCRLVQFAGRNSLGNLKEIEILCAPQGKRWVVDGLTVDKPLCSVCTEPRIS